jgi:hypothetical protein
LLEKAIAGKLIGKRLTKIPSVRTNWKTWKNRNPDTLVLSTKTGYMRDYTRDPYEGYYRVGTIWFPVGDVRKDLAPKERVLGIEINGDVKAYPIALLTKKPGILKDSVGGVPIQLEVTTDGEVVGLRNKDGDPIPHIFAYWFAWQSFHPKTTVYQDEK